jgi:hypothetical protein
MKKTLLIHILMAALLLAGCASGGQTATAAAVGVGIDSKIKTDYTNALPLMSQLAVGTIKLDGTGNAIDKTEAGQLLPLWKVLRTLSTSNTAAVEEINAAIHQIETTMKPEQVTAIASMQLTQQDMAAVFAQRGVGFGSGGGFGGNLTPEQQATRQALRQSGGGGGGPPPGGGFGGGGFGGGGGGGGQVPAAQQTAIAAARSGSGRSSSGVNLGVVNAVIQYLTSKS